MPAVYRNANVDLSSLIAADALRPTRTELGMRTDVAQEYAVEDLRVPVTMAKLEGPRTPIFGKIIDQGGVATSGKSLCFDGVDDYAQGDGTFQDFSNDWSVSFWFWPCTSPGNRARLIYKEDVFEVMLRNNWVYLNLYDGSDRRVGRFLPNQRNHIVITVSISSPKARDIVYINGVQVEDRIRRYTIANNSNDLYLGARKGTDHFYKGKIDDLRFYDAILDSDDVDSLWNGGNGDDSQNPETNHSSDKTVGWHFNESSGTDCQYFTASADPAPNSTYNLTTHGGVTRVDNIIFSSGASQGVFTYIFPSDLTTELFLVAQTPHGRIPGTVLEPHVHFVPLDDSSGDVKWEFEYSWAGVGKESFANTTIITGTETVDSANGALWHYLCTIGSPVHMPADAKKDHSSMIIGRLARLGDDADDTYSGEVGLLEFDFHYAQQGLGNDYRLTPPWDTGI